MGKEYVYCPIRARFVQQSCGRRDRKLLLNRREIRKIQNTVKAPGFSIVPVLLFIDENGRAKLDIHIARGKKEYDKRETLKEKEDRRDISRQFKKSI
jgi:SsrA-binding protein